MKLDRKTLGAGALTLGLVATAGAGVTAAATDTTATDAMQNNVGAQQMRQGFGQGQHTGRAEAEANLLGISVDEFRARIANGENPRDMLSAAGIESVDIGQGRDMRGPQSAEQLAQAVASGTMTQEQADAMAARHAEAQARHDAMENAVNNNDYSTWASLIADAPFADQITINEATFAKFVEAHTLMQSGDHEAAKAIMDELGITPPAGERGMHGGPNGGTPPAGAPSTNDQE